MRVLTGCRHDIMIFDSQLLLRAPTQVMMITDPVLKGQHRSRWIIGVSTLAVVFTGVCTAFWYETRMSRDWTSNFVLRLCFTIDTNVICGHFTLINSARMERKRVCLVQKLASEMLLRAQTLSINNNDFC